MRRSYRKSINLGRGFKINISQSGVGYSWGVPGYRITYTADGKIRKTYSVPGTGIRHTETFNPNGSSPQLSNRSQNQIDSNYIETQNIESADISNFQSTEYTDFIKGISNAMKLNTISTWLCVSFAMIFFHPAFSIIGLIGVLLKIFVHTKGRVNAEYNFDMAKEKEYEDRILAWKSLNDCNKLWQISQTSKIKNTRVAGGAGHAFVRKPFTISTVLPWYLKTNVEAVLLSFKKETMIILPDRLLLIKGSGIGAVSYQNIKYDVYTTNFIEEQSPPTDSELIRHTWKYVKKNGQPDKRFKDNRQLPVYKYAKIDMSSAEGINASILCSNVKVAAGFKKNIV